MPCLSVACLALLSVSSLVKQPFKHGFLVVLLLLTGPVLHAQDVLYLSDRSRIVGTLTGLTHERVSIDVKKKNAVGHLTYGVDQVLAVVNRRGRFVCLDQLWFTPTDRRWLLIEQFLSGRDALPYDMLIRDQPTQVIYGKVKAVRGNLVTYVPLKGPAVDVPKAALIGIFYQSGKHELIAPATVLCDKIDQLGGTLPMPLVASARPAPVAKPPVQSLPKPAAIARPDPTPTRPAGAVLKLTDSEYAEYRQQALERVEEFGVLLGVIADKTTETGRKDKAINQILSMFKADATIQVSSASRDREPLSLRMHDYLRRLKLLPYRSVSLEWTDIQYVQELTQKADGNYYGKIRGEQRFSGLTWKDSIQYSDITEKDVDVMLTPYKKRTEGEDRRKWAVLLGNVGVVATQ